MYPLVLLPYEFLLEQNVVYATLIIKGVLLPYEFLLEQNVCYSFVSIRLVLLPYEFLLEQNQQKQTLMH